MKKFRFLPILLTIILSSCVENTLKDESAAADGEALLKVGLSVDDRLEIVQTKAGELDASLVPPVDSLYVELYRFGKKHGKPNSKEGWNRIYFGKYEEAKEMTWRVNAGDFKLLAFRGDSTACGFDKPYFKAEKDFLVDGGLTADGKPNLTYVDAVAKVSNVRITVNFDETVPGSYYDYFLRFTNLDQLKDDGTPNKYKQVLRYKKGETKDAYMMPTGNLQIEFMAQHEYGDEDSWKYSVIKTIEAHENEHITIDVTVKDPRYGKLGFEITTDRNIEKTETEVEILEAWAPQEAPQIVPAGFPNGEHAVVEGDVTGNSATISVVARAGLKNLYLNVNSAYLASSGIDIPLGTEIDLADPDLDQTIKDKLVAAGFEWQEDMKGSRKLTYIKMTGFFKKVNDLNPSLPQKRDIAAFTIRAVDDVDKETELELTAVAYPVTQTLSIPAGRVWAKRIVSPVLEAGRGVTRLFKLQVSEDGKTWNDFASFVSANGSQIDFGTLSVNSDTRYYFRTMYNGNENLVSNVVEVVTEKEQQVGNPGFEDYQTLNFKVSVQAGGTYDREWYLPYNAGETDPWWAVNSKKTMPSSHSVSNDNFKCFPCTGFSTNRYTGEKSAMVFTVNVNWWNTDGSSFGDKVPGEIWIGTADDSGNHVKDGHAFASRPDVLKFWYKYDSHNNENFVVSLIIKDAVGNVIASAEKTDGRYAGEWTLCEMPILYSDASAKAASIYISFKSCTAGDISMNKTIELGGKQQRAHIGSVLRIDDIELTY